MHGTDRDTASLAAAMSIRVQSTASRATASGLPVQASAYVHTCDSFRAPFINLEDTFQNIRCDATEYRAWMRLNLIYGNRSPQLRCRKLLLG